MPNRADTVTRLLDALATAGDLSARKMFGGHTLYLDGKIVGMICDDRLFIKPTPGAIAALPAARKDPPYAGARPHLAPDAALDDPDSVVAALRAAWADLPAPKLKVLRTKPPRRPA